ncbi:hypothetical protein GCM10010174_84480 [Kutzneria viridogrisea]|uniref:Sorbitol-specific phosphotransferase system component IIBC n=2 Tax=Kutzneria TaxID=43356 RepID=A0ABR6BID8_9PSEU|nr:hypothetical protein [Kutzneria albida]AHH95828.1 putative membrane protein [Kutzneria albida DSM 43870]MBA8926652.1 sorbitol-specific phosphotransferase system component IIBC [Kutzneria viridogrisea]
MAAADHTRVPRLIFIVQGVLLVALGAAGLALGQHGSLFDSQPTTAVIGLQLSPVHSLILLAAGVLSIVMAVVRALLGLLAIVQFGAFAVLFMYGLGEPQAFGFNAGSHFLHLGLITIASVCGLMIASPHMGGEH